MNVGLNVPVQYYRVCVAHAIDTPYPRFFVDESYSIHAAINKAKGDLLTKLTVLRDDALEKGWDGVDNEDN
jgi:hypothetical protein